MPHKRRSLFVFPLIILLFSLAGGFYGSRVAAAGAEVEDLGTDVAAFTQAYSLVEQHFAEKVDPDKAIYKGAIPGMLRTMDPHSNFFDPKDYKLLREEQRGHYFGVGMQVGPRDGKTVVMAPFPGNPAYEAGLRPGDIIVSVNGKPTENLTTTEVADLLKGPKGTQVTVVIGREGSDRPLTFTLTRAEIVRASVPDAFWLKPGIAYVKIRSFGESTSRELDENMKRLGEANIKGLVLDLRDNPGGLLNEGVAVTDRFLKKNQVIVSHRGRSSTEKTYVARSGNGGREYPIVVLVNRFSASASEILAGALQDHDRAWIIGERTFGKGLVQTVFPMAYNTGLALTTAHFYTPSGRLIQRDYSNQSFYQYYYRRDNSATSNDVKMTDSGRTVYGGGGITPDETVEAPKLDRFQTELSREVLFSFTRHYFATRNANLSKGWMPDESTLNELRAYMKQRGTNFSEEDITKHRDWILRNLAREMYTTAFNVDVAEQMFARTDSLVEKAVESMPKATALVETAKKIIAQRMNSQQQQQPAQGSSQRR